MFNFVWRVFVSGFGLYVKFHAQWWQWWRLAAFRCQIWLLSFMHNGGVESFWGAPCAEIGPSQRQVVQNICKSVFLKLLVARFSFYAKFPAQWWCRKLLGGSVRRDRAVTVGSDTSLRNCPPLTQHFFSNDFLNLAQIVVVNRGLGIRIVFKVCSISVSNWIDVGPRWRLSLS